MKQISIFGSFCLLLLFVTQNGCNQKEPQPTDTETANEISSESHQPEPGDEMTNSLGMKLVWIPAGEFKMSSPSNEEGRGDDEDPQHRVRISKGFWMGVFEVTQKEYQAIMGSNPSGFKGDNLPVETVSWDDAVRFCSKLSKKEGKTYRLPTEAEWEYACRAGTQTRFGFGDSDSSLGDYAWYGSNSGGKTHSGGQKKANAFGLYDMHGNVLEWCQDRGGRYSNSPEVDSRVPAASRVIRGGSWSYDPSYCRSAYRSWAKSGLTSNYLGFRVVFPDF